MEHQGAQTRPQPQKQPQAPEQPQNVRKHLKYKSRLQEYAQKSNVLPPVYHTVNEGFPHAPRFKCTIMLNGEIYKSTNTFAVVNDAEEDSAKSILDGLSERIKEEACSLISEDTMFCKSIMNEYAMKMGLPNPTYSTAQADGVLPVFVSSCFFDGITYSGKPGRNKKDAEQLAARAAILSLLGNSGTVDILAVIIKSKTKLYAPFHNVQNLHEQSLPAPIEANSASGTSTYATGGKEFEHTKLTGDVIKIVATDPPQGQLSSCPTTHQPHHEFVRQEQEPVSEAITLPITFVPPLQTEPPMNKEGSGKKRNRKNRKKANKKQKSGEQFQTGVLEHSLLLG